MSESPEPKKILVVEDEQSLRTDIVDILVSEGFEVFQAENGRIGINQAKNYLPDLIICDIKMPEADGYEMLAELQTEPRTAAIPFIFVTALTDEADRREGMGRGAYDYITKPFSIDELLQSIKMRLTMIENVKQTYEDRNRTLRNNLVLALPHELRTPLTVVLGFSNILVTDASRMERNRITEMAEHINQAGNRLYHLIENYLVYAQIEIAAHDPDYHELFRTSRTRDAKTLIEAEVVHKARQYQRESDLVVDIHQIKGSIHILDDYLKKIVEELMDNALKFSTPGTPVTVTWFEEARQAQLCIADQGRGMTADQIRNIGAYMQFDRRVYEQQGPGLGLTIVRRIAEIHDGQFQLDSIPDQQTTARVRLRIEFPE